jgi:hypothetical protein
METSLAIGPEGKLKFDIADGKIEISTEYTGKDLSAGAFIATTPEQLVSALAEIIPGDSGLEKGVLGMLRMGLEAAMSTTDPKKVAAAIEAGRDLKA